MEKTIVQTVLDAFHRLNKKGKPVLKKQVKQGQDVTWLQEWTVLAGIVMVYKDTYECIALGTGLKCVGQTRVRGAGDGVNDSHAEVMCRRSFLRYMYGQIALALQDPNKSIVQPHCKEPGKWQMKPGYTFHMYVSQAMCGDASMTSLESHQSREKRLENEAKKRHYKEEQDMKRQMKRIKTPSSLVLRGRLDYDQVGQCRTKPGRMDCDPTLSMSCTDKMLKWCLVGLQGSLLSLFLDSIYLTSLCLGDYYNQQDVQRSLLDRYALLVNTMPHSTHLHPPIIYSTPDPPFPFSQTYLSSSSSYPLLPSDTSIAWNNLPEHDVLVQGIKQGAARPKLHIPVPPSSRSLLCKASLFQLFKHTLHLYSESAYPLPSTLQLPHTLSYYSTKQLSLSYTQSKSIFLKGIPGWIKTQPQDTSSHGYYNE